MGNWYTNISLQGVSPAEILPVLEELGRRAYVTPAISSWCTLYDQECDRFDLDVLESLALTLSMRLNCTALASFNADDDVLWLGVYKNGDRTARYASTRSFFEDGGDFPEPSEVAALLCQVFDKPRALAAVRRILRRPHSGAAGLLAIILRIPFAYLFEIARHQDLRKALELPTGSVGGGYKYVDRGEMPQGVAPEMIKKTLGGRSN
jgi:hypothetical protein